MNRLMTDDIQTQETPDPPRPRRGCSCWGMLLYGVFGLIALFFFGKQCLFWYLDWDLKRSVAPERLAAMQNWIHTPLNVQWDKVNLPPYLDPNATEQKFPPDLERLYEEFVHGYNDRQNSVIDRVEELGTLRDKVYAAAPLTDAERADLTTITAQLLPMAEAVARMVQHPDYSRDHPSQPGLPHDELLDLTATGLALLAYSHLHNNKPESATETIDLMLRFNRFGGWLSADDNTERIGYAQHNYQIALGHAMRFALVADRLSTAPTLLEQTLQVMNNHRDAVETTLRPVPPVVMPGVLLLREMMTTGYLESTTETTSPTLSFLLNVVSEGPRYNRWLTKNYPPEGEAHKAGRARLDEYIASQPGNSIVQQVFYRVSTWGSQLHKEQPLFGEYIFWKSRWMRHADRELVVVKYDLTRLHLARRIAELRGESLPVTEQDFVPKYMPEFPTDPHTGKPYEFSNSEQMFFSAGYDGIPGNENDEKLELPSGIYVPPKSLTPEEEAEAARLFEDMSGGMLLPVSE